MNKNENSPIILQTVKQKSSGVVSTITNMIHNAIGIFKKDEAVMSSEEKIEKQHTLTFIYGMGAGIVIYHFLIGALLLLGILWFYSLSLKKTKVVVEEQKPKKRTYRRRTKKTETETKIEQKES